MSPRSIASPFGGVIRVLREATGTFPEMAHISLLTTQRRGAVEKTRWRNDDADRAVWTIHAAALKPGRLQETPLTRLVIDEFARGPRESVYVVAPPPCEANGRHARPAGRSFHREIRAPAYTGHVKRSGRTRCGANFSNRRRSALDSNTRCK